MLVLAETPVGYTLWRVNNKSVLQDTDVCRTYPTLDDAQSVLSLHQYRLFANAQEAIESLAAAAKSEVCESLAEFLTENIVNAGIKEQLQVADASLARAIEKLGISAVGPSGQRIPEIFRLIRQNITDMLPEVTEETFRSLELGIAHGIATKTLKFSPSKVDSMIVNSVNLLEELDKEINNYGMRVREWYGWHFPELRNVTADNLLFSQLVLEMGRKEGCFEAKLDHLLTPPMIEEVRKLAHTSIGTELSDDDLACVQALARQVIELIEFRSQISEYIRQRMRAVAPNLTELVGESVGSRLIAHAGSLNQLAKAAGSTIQVFGAEKALFRAKKEGKPTPKYGLIYHAQIVSHADQKLKGKISRGLASKIAISTRVDAYSEEPDGKIGVSDLERLENHVRQMEGQQVKYEVSRAAVKKTPAKIIVEETPNYKQDEDFQIEAEKPKKKHRKHRHHTENNEEQNEEQQAAE